MNYEGLANAATSDAVIMYMDPPALLLTYRGEGKLCQAWLPSEAMRDMWEYQSRGTFARLVGSQVGALSHDEFDWEHKSGHFRTTRTSEAQVGALSHGCFIWGLYDAARRTGKCCSRDGASILQLSCSSYSSSPY